MPGWFDDDMANRLTLPIPTQRDDSLSSNKAKNTINSLNILPTEKNVAEKALTNVYPSGIFYMVHKKQGGKVKREICEYILKNDEIHIEFPKTFENINDETLSNVVNKDNDPTANIPFNLKLTDEQKSAKENVQLPYLEAQNF
ncbi:hypothetical protein BB559_005902 [Furculomyces boomerangus]|uniref:Elongator complex protein 5 n=2 Tax=Harpellales TaxID=61421 RepID=A0A2T9Y615_9FUNG|nr:hypothetical protein BB559_005902 [Furculomyces boomerangus]PVZ97467.1 hypothetical protein BB558_006575 [Smittium angustum]